MRTRDDVRSEKYDWCQSLSKILPDGVSITDIEGFFSNELDSPTFKLSCLVLSNGERVRIEGEHDYPYLCEIQCLPEGQDEVLIEPD